MLWAEMQAIDLVYETWRAYRAENADWTKLTATQRAIIAELEDDDE
jgi:hypothetical protein